MVSPARLPRLLGVVVIAFAQFEDRPLLGAVGLFRGLAIQLAYRWATGRIVAEPGDRAVLLWSDSPRWGARVVAREALGMAIALVVGVVLLVISSLLLLAPIDAALDLAGVGLRVTVEIGLVVVIVRWLMTCYSAVRSYENERALVNALPRARSVRWRIDYLAAIPARSGHGGQLLDLFLERADRRGAEIVLHCDRRNVPFYRRHGFAEVSPRQAGGQRVMRRSSPQPHRADPRLARALPV